jgi:hypothetical protein
MVYKLLGYPKSVEGDFVSESINIYKQKCRDLISPGGGYLIKKIDALNTKNGIIIIDEETWEVNRIIASQLNDSTYIALFVGSIGNEVEELSESLFQKGDPFDGYITNLIGSEAAEAVARAIHDTLKSDMMIEGLSITNRFSPGYCGWDVAEQFKLFRYFPYDKCKVRLTESALMEPVKSVSGIIGIGKDVSIKSYPCYKCTRENCIYKSSH